MLYRTLHFLEQRWLRFPFLTSGTQTIKLERLSKKINGCQLGADFGNDLILAGHDQTEIYMSHACIPGFFDDWIYRPDPTARQ